MKAYIKDILREVRHSMGRFFSIMAIVAIGTAFFAGVKASVPDMLHTADDYFREYNLMDIRLMSSMGFTKEDVEAIRKADGLEGVMPTHTMDFITHKGTTQHVVKAISLPKTDKDDPDYINHVRLISGRMPQNPKECLVEEQELKDMGYRIGDTITLESGTKSAVSEYLKQDTYTIVGTAYTPDYLNYSKGTSTIGNGTVDLFIMIDDENFVSDYYTEVLVTVKGADAYDSYGDAYFEVVDKVSNELTSIGMDRSDIRYAELQKLAQQEFDKGKAEYEAGVSRFEDEIAEGEAKLESAKDQLLLGTAQLTSSKANFETMQTTTQLQITQGEASIAQYEAQLNEVVALKQQMQEEIQPLLDGFENQIAQAEKRLDEIERQLADPNVSESERALLEAEKKVLEQSIAAAQKSIESTKAALVKMEEKVQYFQQQIASGKAQLAAAKQQLANGQKTAQQEFTAAQAKLDTGQKAYVEGKLELEKNRKLGEKELELAKEELSVAEQQLQKLPQPNWYVLDRNSHYAYRDYESVTQRMDGIAKVFPLFFLIVCALVCLTTMTLMVDEQRGMIGTYKALGYSNGKIAMKYLAYALVAGVVGSIIGCVVGMLLFPSVIFNAWNLMYNLPELKFVLQLPLAIASSVSVIAVTLLATFVACYKELTEVPALLMRPKPPKSGKTILLERISFLWKRFSFSQKVTARNIIRYKKRFFMTVIGISGCTALLVAGFGIQDSISEVVDKQYEEIMRYDAMLSFDTDSTYKQRDAIIEELKSDSLVKDQTALMQINATVKDNGEDTAVSVIVPEDSAAFEQFVKIANRKSGKELSFANDGAIITEKLAMNMKLSVGDTLSIALADGVSKDVKISGIMENYVGHYVYMTPAYYKQLSQQRNVSNALYIKMNKVNDKNESTLGNRYMEKDGVSSMAFYHGVAESFDDTIASLNFVIYVLIGAAGLLAFVVLYNLTNVNVSERIREIATIKVLGFYPLEVASYVYRENLVLTLIGGLCGLCLGIGLHALIMNLAEMPEIMFGRNIDASSFVFALILTLVFSMAVNLVMYRKLQKIPMVESLKSVE